MTILKVALEKRGITIREAARAGIPYCTVWQQCKGMRPVGPHAALRYEAVLGIPRSELRPDLWPPAESPGMSTLDEKDVGSG